MTKALFCDDATISIGGFHVHHGRARKYVEGISAQKESVLK